MIGLTVMQYRGDQLYPVKVQVRFYQTGWLCANILEYLHLVDTIDLKARKPPGQPRKKTICLDRDGPRRSQYTVDALMKRLVDKPASVINWSILKIQIDTGGDGGQNPVGKRYWNIQNENLQGMPPMDIEELARTINYFFQMGHNIAPH
ncbi:Hypothetical protein PHPALM_13225 [Phytophthora palmivora]|uniref:Uncharacterized protein n=1 Tax=Phytophthora palmivora TaxID=4796 RepID=A0A2P4XXQ2_9STRA|nr:Hypothetical protein PHPALM_13225 [Phytophthora palmivora]